jgi:hypothetical protein
MESVHEWEEIVPETRCEHDCYVPGGMGQYQYKININYDDKENETRVVCVNFWDAFYVKKFSLVHVETGEDIKRNINVIFKMIIMLILCFLAIGVNIGDNFRNRWAFKSPPKREYQVLTSGGLHKCKFITNICQNKIKNKQIRFRCSDAMESFQSHYNAQ